MGYLVVDWGQNIKELGCCNLNLNMWPKFLRLKMKCFSQDEGKPLRLRVKVGWMWIQMHCVNSMKVNEVTIEKSEGKQPKPLKLIFIFGT